jgi:hypothetical protein
MGQAYLWGFLRLNKTGTYAILLAASTQRAEAQRGAAVAVGHRGSVERSLCWRWPVSRPQQRNAQPWLAGQAPRTAYLPSSPCQAGGASSGLPLVHLLRWNMQKHLADCSRKTSQNVRWFAALDVKCIWLNPRFSPDVNEGPGPGKVGPVRCLHRWTWASSLVFNHPLHERRVARIDAPNFVGSLSRHCASHSAVPSGTC